MKTFIISILISAILALLLPINISAQEVAESSAVLKIVGSDQGYDFRVENLKAYLLRFNSPLAEYAVDFVGYADENGLDYRMVPAISGVESTFGKRIPQNSYNAYGWANGDHSFKSWDESIKTVSEALNTKYIQKGAVSLPQIARRYAPPSTTWGKNVKFFMGKIDPLPVSFDI
jgi:hypothetical protein